MELNEKALAALKEAVEGECEGLAIDDDQAAAILTHVFSALPADAGEAVAPAPAVNAGVVADIPDYDAGLLSDYGKGLVDWWQEYIRAEIGRANDHWRSALASAEASPTPTEGDAGVREALSDEQIIELAVCHSNYRENLGDKSWEVFSPERIIEFARALLALSRPSGDGWRSMDSAPKDGMTRILAFNGERVGEAVQYGEWDDSNDFAEEIHSWRWANDSCSCCWYKMSPQPIAWMPLPTPPSSGEGR